MRKEVEKQRDKDGEGRKERKRERKEHQVIETKRERKIYRDSGVESHYLRSTLLRYRKEA